MTKSEKTLAVRSFYTEKNFPDAIVKLRKINQLSHTIKKAFQNSCPQPGCHLKVPKRENFSLAFFALSEPIWVCDLGTGEKNLIFIS